MSRTKLYLVAAVAFVFNISGAEARDQIRIVGSSTVFPFVTTAAEQFGQSGGFKTPIVESTGTGGGFKLFCSGAGMDTPDVANASRAVLPSEVELCRKNGVTLTEISIGYDGIVIAASSKSPVLDLTRKDIFLAIARDIPKDGKLVKNPYRRWKDVNSALADEPIEVYGPPPTSGTRDAFVELGMEAVCMDIPEFKSAYPDAKVRAKACHAIREDGRYIDSGEDDNVIVQKLKTNPDAIGVFGYSYFSENRAALRGMKVDGHEPTFDNISGGAYPLARKLYVYVKNEHIGKVAGLGDFVRELTSPAALSADGYMAAKGMITLRPEEAEAVRKKAAAVR